MKNKIKHDARKVPALLLKQHNYTHILTHTIIWLVACMTYKFHSCYSLLFIQHSSLFRNVVCLDLVTTVRRLSRNILDETKLSPVNNCKDCPFRHGLSGHFRLKKLKKRVSKAYSEQKTCGPNAKGSLLP